MFLHNFMIYFWMILANFSFNKVLRFISLKKSDKLLLVIKKVILIVNLNWNWSQFTTWFVVKYYGLYFFFIFEGKAFFFLIVRNTISYNYLCCQLEWKVWRYILSICVKPVTLSISLSLHFFLMQWIGKLPVNTATVLQIL